MPVLLLSFIERIDFIAPLMSIKIIVILYIWMVFPNMYSITKLIGRDLPWVNANSHALCGGSGG